MTTARAAKTRIRTARTELALAQSGIKRDLAPWREAFNRRRTAWIVAGGFAGGLALAWLPPRLWAKIGSVAGSGAALAARSLLTPMIAGALLARKQPPVTPVVQDQPSAAAD
jgi:polyferredoxin